jgi:rare lipoprotein A
VGTKRPPGPRTIILSEKAGKGKPYMVHGQKYYPLPHSYGFSQVGKASWYGKKFHGKTTSTGEVFNMYRKSAAHKTLPLNTYVSVLNLENGKSTVVRINDRGPFVRGRVIDLSYAAAKEIDLIGPGLADVKVVALGKQVGKVATGKTFRPILELDDFIGGEFTIQVGAFQDRANAIELARRLKVIFDYVNVTSFADADEKTFYRVHVSKSRTLPQAEEIEKELEDMGFTEAFIVRI